MDYIKIIEECRVKCESLEQMIPTERHKIRIQEIDNIINKTNMITIATIFGGICMIIGGGVFGAILLVGLDMIFNRK